MLRVTPAAGLAIRRLVESQGAPADGALRIEARADQPDFDIAFAAQPDETDLVVTEEATGARVVLDSLTAEYVADRTLDVDDTVESTVRFRLSHGGETDES